MMSITNKPNKPFQSYGTHPTIVKTKAENYTNTQVQQRIKTPSPPPTPPPDFASFKKILIFDVETTGLPPYSMNPEKPQSVDLSLVPYITQLSFIIYDTETRLITHIFDEYIDIPDHIDIRDEITQITGIDRDILDAKGIPMFYAISVFLQSLKHCDCLVAHNISFDIKMIRFEMMRYAFCQTGVFDNLELYCTMRNSQSICKLISPKTGRIKPPKLSELYSYLFNESVENLHNSIIDVLVCFRCFLKITYNHHIPSNIFVKIIQFNYEAMYESPETDNSAILCL